jgi:hypothetical protein
MPPWPLVLAMLELAGPAPASPPPAALLLAGPDVLAALELAGPPPAPPVDELLVGPDVEDDDGPPPTLAVDPASALEDALVAEPA